MFIYDILFVIYRKYVKCWCVKSVAQFRECIEEVFLVNQTCILYVDHNDYAVIRFTVLIDVSDNHK
jgi:hypothetical protein